jgi:DNA polymerase
MNEKEVLVELLKWYKDMGIDEVVSKKPNNRTIQEKDSVQLNTAQPTPPSTKVTTITQNSSHKEIVAYARFIADNATSIEGLRGELEKFEGCSIKKTAMNTVFCDGTAHSEIMLIGEAPGANEDIQGRPFCGDSGKLLDSMLASIGLSRDKNFYITNTIFWRPPGNRRPTDEELEICLPFVEKHIALIKPKVILLVGATAVTSILKSKESISKLRQKFFKYNNSYLEQPIDTTSIFHPSYLLRQPSQKRLVWHDLLNFKQFLRSNNIKF